MLNTPYTLPCGTVLKNRLVKAAMTERIGDHQFEPILNHEHLYEMWAETGAGLLISGNVIIDRKHPESAGNVAFDDRAMLPKLRSWAASGLRDGNQFWVQISHAGRQTSRFNNLRPMAPSAIQFKKFGLFGKPTAMKPDDIQDVIKGFVRAAAISKEAGFTGLQIHAAHGYLLSQFLSPRTNQRTDKWGGSIENRCRLLLKIIEEVRKEVGREYPISVKINSSDFQQGGLSEKESLSVIKKLEKAGIDLLEISGGTYENVAFFLWNEQKESTHSREAYFMDFAVKVREISSVPIMITGGFRTHAFCQQVLANNELDLIGMGRPFISNVRQIKGFLSGELTELDDLVIRTGIKQFDDAAEGGYYARQIIRFSKGTEFRKNLNPIISAVFLIVYEFKKALSRKLKTALI